MSVIAQAGERRSSLHKFGGSSLADAGNVYLRVAGIADGVFAGGRYDGRLRRRQYHQPVDQLAELSQTVASLRIRCNNRFVVIRWS